MLSNAEWEVMRVVWAHDEHEGITSKEVCSCLENKNDWKATTIKTLLGRMVKKDVLKVKKQQNKYIYYATISEKDYDMEVLNLALERVCNKKKPQLIGELIEQSLLTNTDRIMLKEILDEHPVVERIPCECSKGQCECAES